MLEEETLMAGCPAVCGVLADFSGQVDSTVAYQAVLLPCATE